MTTPKFEHSEIQEMMDKIAPWPWSSKEEGSDVFILNKDKEKFLCDEVCEIRIPRTINFIIHTPEIITQLLAREEELVKQVEGLKKVLAVGSDLVSILVEGENTLPIEYDIFLEDLEKVK